MKRMKILTCTLATLAMVMSTYIPLRVQATFMGTISKDRPWELNVVNK